MLSLTLTVWKVTSAPVCIKAIQQAHVLKSDYSSTNSCVVQPRAGSVHSARGALLQLALPLFPSLCSLQIP